MTFAPTRYYVGRMGYEKDIRVTGTRVAIYDTGVRVFVCFYIAVDIQHTQCPYRFFLLDTCTYKLCGHKTTTQEIRLLYVHCTAVSRVGNATACHRTGYDRYEMQMLAIQTR